MRSLKLTEDWRLALDAAGNLATVEKAERIVQDVASYERMFQGEAIYEQERGVPYLNNELGAMPPNELVIARSNARAKQVPGVDTAKTELFALGDDRTLRGRISVTTDEGEQLNVSI